MDHDEQLSEISSIKLAKPNKNSIQFPSIPHKIVIFYQHPNSSMFAFGHHLQAIYHPFTAPIRPLPWSSRKVPWNTAAPNGRSVANWPGRALGSVEAADGPMGWADGSPKKHQESESDVIR